MIAPCKGCPERQPGCHDTCEQFADYRAYLAEINGKRREYIRVLDYVYSNAKKCMLRKIKRMKRGE